jgi:prefoldin subunit 5
MAEKGRLCDTSISGATRAELINENRVLQNRIAELTAQLGTVQRALQSVTARVENKKLKNG